ncbi:predicted protein [Uncinocarpus reesii 1704]|uniref:Uncharacterized protein n=1 Tax=Uncinocarpus reesii (strain UAMH 1704) TaxID=336963 RepID=C4JS31_UNCRE|nr:uncharacterized protein UREG_05270 [Uncinocarpus reesii 1704]EEP80428.1 predicted protein [Uncinocarpus reesii 1704]
MGSQRRQTFLEGLINFPEAAPLTTGQRSQAKEGFERIIEYFGNNSSSIGLPQQI